MVTRQINPFDPTVVSVCAIKAGTASNVIPEYAEIDGTIRAISEATRVKVHDLIKQVAEGVAAAHGADVEVTVRRDYPVTVNDADKSDFMIELATTITGADNVFRLPNPVMGAEDFSFVLNKLPGAMMFLGATPRDRAPWCGRRTTATRASGHARASSTHRRSRCPDRHASRWGG